MVPGDSLKRTLGVLTTKNNFNFKPKTEIYNFQEKKNGLQIIVNNL